MEVFDSVPMKEAKYLSNDKTEVPKVVVEFINGLIDNRAIIDRAHKCRSEIKDVKRCEFFTESPERMPLWNRIREKVPFDLNIPLDYRLSCIRGYNDKYEIRFVDIIVCEGIEPELLKALDNGFATYQV